MQKEIWKPVKGYEGFYEISNYGNVKNVQRGNLRKLLLNKDGYVEILLSKNGSVKSVRVHRLVAEAFIPNPDKKPEVNHKDYNKSNNYIENLEWTTRKENVNHSDLRVRHFKNKCCIYIDCRKTNTGEHHISYRKNERQFYVQIRTKNMKIFKGFKDINEAIKYRDIAIDKLNAIGDMR